MRAGENKYRFWQLSVGVVAALAGLIPVSLTFCDSLDLPARIGAGFFGLSLYVVGARFILRTPAGEMEEPILPTHALRLGHLHLNGDYFVAYEDKDRDGKRRFRLASVVRLSPEREAALIRYLILEGFVVSLWPQMRGRIENEAGWAFMV